jgi:hypothetical protein
MLNVHPVFILLHVIIEGLFNDAPVYNLGDRWVNYFGTLVEWRWRGEHRSTWGKNASQCDFVHHKSHMGYPEMILSLSGVARPLGLVSPILNTPTGCPDLYVWKEISKHQVQTMPDERFHSSVISALYYEICESLSNPWGVWCNQTIFLKCYRGVTWTREDLGSRCDSEYQGRYQGQMRMAPSCCTHLDWLAVSNLTFNPGYRDVPLYLRGL